MEAILLFAIDVDIVRRGLVGVVVVVVDQGGLLAWTDAVQLFHDASCFKGLMWLCR
jgi:hypothetical protein